MINQYLSKLYTELELGPSPTPEKDGSFKAIIASFPIKMAEANGIVHFSASVAPLPTRERESFLLTMMQANFLGQGTGGGTLGVQEDESSLTLSLSLPYEMNYNGFKDAVDEFVNFLEYWKKEAARHEAAGQIR